MNIKALLRKLTLAEKVGQMTQVTSHLYLKDDSSDQLDPKKLAKAVVDKKVGSILNVKTHAFSLEKWDEIMSAIQENVLKTKNKIPVLYGIDSIHGATYVQGATLFPHNIGMAATRNNELVAEAAKITAIETRAAGIPWNFDPVFDVGRTPAWARVEETFGEDPHLCAQMGGTIVTAYQGNDLRKSDTVAACMKHFLGYSSPDSGHDRTPTNMSDNQLREIFLPPFQEAVNRGVATVMINSGEVNGVPVHGSYHLLTTILRKELKFKGLAVTDWEDIIRLHTRHRIAATPKEAVGIAINAGIDMSMVPFDFSFHKYLIELVKEGVVPMKRIDEAVTRILKLKKALGLFENPLVKGTEKVSLNAPESQQTSLEAARATMTLLKNGTGKKSVLPFSKKTKILLAGPAANNVSCLHGSWSWTWQGQDVSQYPKSVKTIRKALTDRIGKKNVICFSKSKYEAADNFNIKKLQTSAKKVDQIILCLGEDAYAEGPGYSPTLILDDRQMALAVAAIQTGKPVTLVLVQGRPRIIRKLVPDAAAILLAYRPGPMGAQAIVETLFGDHNPGGKLAFSYPRHSNNLISYDHKYSAAVQELTPAMITDGGYNPQWPFGYGLSYTSFNIGKLKLSRNKLRKGNLLKVTTTVKNTGKKTGTIGVDCFIRDCYASVTPPVKRLKRYAAITLAAGEERKVVFELDNKDLSFIDQRGKRVVEPGDFEVLVEGTGVEQIAGFQWVDELCFI